MGWINRALWLGQKEPIAAFTGFVAIFTLFLALIAGLQYCVLNYQLQEAKDENRPWVYVERAEPNSAFTSTDTSAEIALLFHLTNTGKSPAQLVNIGGDFSYVTLNSVDDVKKIYEKRQACDDLKKANMAGSTIFPGQRMPLIHAFKMDSKNVAEWKNKNGEKLGVFYLVGCADYVFTLGGQHHQTRFIYEVDKRGENNSFLPIEPSLGEIPANQLILGENPLLAKDAD
jgi:hypothetical protein